MRILLTGATGFLGRHLTRGLVAAGHEVVALVRNAERGQALASLADQIQVLTLDRHDPRQVCAQEPNLDTVIHAATHYGRGADRRDVLEVNVALPLALIDGLQERGGGTFINTDTCFNKHPGSYRYLAAYTTSKQHLLEWLRLAADGGDLAIANLRLEHPYGPGDAQTKMVTAMIRRCLDREEVIALTPGEQQRDFIYIDDVVRAYLTVLDHGLPRPGELVEYQVGRGETASIRELMAIIVELCGAPTRLDFGALPYRDNEIMRSVADLRALRALGFDARVALREGLARTIAAAREVMAAEAASG
jgi:nucleoside-diphosphate-sugar epimerase